MILYDTCKRWFNVVGGSIYKMSTETNHQIKEGRRKVVVKTTAEFLPSQKSGPPFPSPVYSGGVFKPR